MRYFDRDISWLQFNESVLLEAAKDKVPLYERINFLSIFSSNLDEFFRVRYPALKLSATHKADSEGQEILTRVQLTINRQQQLYGTILREQVLPALKEHNIHLYYNELPEAAHLAFIRDYFYTQALSFLQPVILQGRDKAPELQNSALYFLVSLENTAGAVQAIVNIPDAFLSRFITIPGPAPTHHILFLDDVIRYNIDKVFPGYEVISCFSIKMTRNADIDIVDENSDLFEEHLQEMIRSRELGTPTRMLYETGMPEPLLQFVADYFGIDRDSMVAGGRYHNLKDLSRLPNPVGNSLRYPARPPLAHARLSSYNSLLEAMGAGDTLLHFPYHTYSYILRFFNEAAIDPYVSEISVTLYRVAQDSFITNALISAARNGKTVTAFVELKARFDETNNLNWAKKMKAAGVRIIYSIPGIKVHAKLALVKRKQGFDTQYYGLLSTGNFNEQTARFYTDHILLTCRPELTREMDLLFAFLGARQLPAAYPYLQFSQLLVAGFNFMQRLTELVDREISHQQNGRSAGITIKLNNLQEKEAIELLYKASNAGVKVDLIIRGICCLVPGVPGRSEHITVRKLIGRYLEHSRIYAFDNGGEPDVYIGSADLMTRNIRRRVEVIAPVADTQCRRELLDVLQIQLSDNVQATNLDSTGALIPVLPEAGDTEMIAQELLYNYIEKP